MFTSLKTFLTALCLGNKITPRTVYICDYIFLIVHCLDNKITLRTVYIFDCVF